jgi:hypothetical protein
VNSTIVPALRRIHPAWRGAGRGPFVCSAVILCAAITFFIVERAQKMPAGAIARPKTLPSALATLAAQNAAQRLADFGWAFEPNVGQSAPQVRFLARARDATVFLTDDSVYFSWHQAQHDGQQRAKGEPSSVRLQFSGAKLRAMQSGETPLPGKTNYLLGSTPNQWHPDVPRYAAVKYVGLYAGVDARFYGDAQGLEYDLTVAPHSDLRQISLSFRGADALQLDRRGNLLIRAGARELTMKRPYIYQWESGKRRSIAGGYRLNGNKIEFEAGNYQSDLPLVIDPTISIAYTTFLGGAGAEKGNSVAVDSSGDIYVGGTTTLASFPETTTFSYGPANGTSTLFVAKIDPTQTGAASLLYLTFIGGSGSDQGGMVALDNSASPPDLAILGWTTSTNFPVTIQGSALNGPSDLTITELNGTGGAPVYSEYFGGSGAEATQGVGGIATDSFGDVFITSDTASTNFPVTPATAFQPTYGGGASDGILAEFAPAVPTQPGETPGMLLYATYFGINATVGGSGVAVDSSGNAYVAGFTSAPTTFPFMNAFQTSYGGGAFDGFVMEIVPSVSGTAGLVYASLLGGSGTDEALSIGVDTSTPADAYVSGLTQSPNLIPSTGVTNSPFQSSLGAGATQNGFFAVINQTSGVPVLQYLTYLGGSASDSAAGVAVFSPTQVYVAGNATSTNFPSLCSLQGFSGTQDAFLAEFNPAASGSSSMLYTTLLAGTVTAQANAVGADPSGNAIIFGDTVSPDYPLAQNPGSGVQPICTSCTATTPLSDAFLTKINVSAAPAACVAFTPTAVNIGSFADGTTSPPENITVTNDGDSNLTISSSGITITPITPANITDFSQTNTCVANSPLAPGNTCSFSITFTPSIIGQETALLQVADNGVGSPQTLTLTGTGTGVGVTLSGNSLTFPDTAQGQVSAAPPITLTNTSADVLNIQQVSFQGANPTDFEFAAANTCAASVTIQPSGTCTIAVQFAPNEPNPPATGLPLSAQDVVTIQDATNQSTQSITVQLSGTEIPSAPAIEFSPTSLTFGGQNVGSATAPQSITITNNGTAPLAISSVSITGANPADFSETNTCLANSPLAPTPTASCTISVTFKPTAAGPRAANVSVADNAPGSPQTVPLAGTGTAAGVSLTPSSLTFAGQNPGTPPSPPQSVTLENTGTGPLTISSITVTGANASDFLETNSCPGSSATLPAGEACSIAVTFAPTGTGTRTASLTVSDSAIPSPQVVSLSGLGTMPNAQFNLPRIQFGTVVVGAQSSNQAVGLNNTGNGALVVTGVRFTGANPGDFQASGGCVGANGASVSVAPGSNCAVTVVFAPTAAGSRSAVLSVSDNAPGSPQQIPVTGNATNVTLGPVSGGTTSVTITPGETATFSLQAAPQNDFSGTLTISCSDPIPASACTASPASVSISGGATAGFTVSVTTTAAGGASGIFFMFINPWSGHKLLLFVSWLLALAFVSLWRSRWRRRCVLRPALALAGVLLISSCGGSNNNSPPGATPAGTYTVTVTGAITGVTSPPTTSLTLTVQ